MHTISATGNITVETRDLKRRLMPTIASIMNDMKDVLTDTTRQACINVTEILNNQVALMEIKPVLQLDVFAESVRAMRNVHTTKEQVEDDITSVEEMFRLLHNLDVKVSHVMAVQLDDMRASLKEHELKLTVLENYVDENIPAMKQELDAQIIKVEQVSETLYDYLSSGILIDAHAPYKTVLVELNSCQKRVEKGRSMKNKYTDYQQLFEIGVAFQFEQHQLADDKYEQRALLWELTNTFQLSKVNWLNVDINDLNVNEVAGSVEEIFVTSHKLNKKFKDEVSEKLLNSVKHFRADVPTIVELGNPSMKAEHWEQIYKIMGLDPEQVITMDFTLTTLMDNGIMDFQKEISDISGTASGQSRLLESLVKIESVWETLSLPLLSYRGGEGKYILGDLEELMITLEDHQVMLQAMLASKDVALILEKVDVWQKRLSLFSDTIDEWLGVQRDWMYLENIFSAEDICTQLPNEATKFSNVDADWNSTMRSISLDPRALICVSEEKFGAPNKLLLLMQHNKSVLESVQKSLEAYLRVKREAFPRFYFLSNDELLEILAQATRNPKAVEKHLRKCFDAVSTLEWKEQSSSFSEDAGPPDVLAMNSVDGEHVVFTAPVQASGGVERWLLAIEAMMRMSLCDQTLRTMLMYPDDANTRDRQETYEKRANRQDWLKCGESGQMILLVDQIMWTRNATRALVNLKNGMKDSLSDFLQYSDAQIKNMVVMVRDRSMKKTLRKTLGTLLTIDVHSKDTIEALSHRAAEMSVDHFEWQKQMRFYWHGVKEDDEDNDDDNNEDNEKMRLKKMEMNMLNDDFDNWGSNAGVAVHQANAKFKYGWEYLGNGMRLVVTPLTDKIYLTLTGALQLKMGGAPAGPAGTGKTETTKDLGKSMGRQVVVFNCQEGMDSKFMGQFFSGLASGGAWACFDEFNRIGIEVLSVIAQQVQTIQRALVNNQLRFDFEGNEIALSQNFGVFITMNPGYAGRTALPDNLKALFRPVACMVPDYRLIAEIILFSQGFDGASELALKMTQLYTLSSEQLSSQSHYDFGMRAVKSVLMMAGRLKMQNAEIPENILLIRALRDSNVPKFVSWDVPLFQRIITDLFPGVVVPFVDYGALQSQIERELTNHGLQPVPTFVNKVIQVHETMLVRHGMMLVGETGSGKTTNLKTLAAALTQLHSEGIQDPDQFFRPCDCFVLNPKSVSVDELYGKFNLLTQEWKNGIVATLVRETVNSDGNGRRKWIIFDGPVDTLWIESMNTVLDDNKVLCLSSGERLNVSKDVHMVFEVLDLDQASPATVSRCGMVYMEQVHVGLNALIETWDQKRRKIYAFVAQPIVVVNAAATKTQKQNKKGQVEQEEGTEDDNQDDQDQDDNQDENQEDYDNKEEEEEEEMVEMTVESELEREERSYRDESMDRLVGVLKRHLIPILNYVTTKAEMTWSLSHYQMTSSVLRLLDTLLDDDSDNSSSDLMVQATLSAEKAASLDNLLVFAMTWSIGAGLNEQSRTKFSNFLIQRLQEHESMLSLFNTNIGETSEPQQKTSDPETTTTTIATADPSDLQRAKTLYDVYLNHDKGTMDMWSKKLKEEPFEYNSGLPYSLLFVPTMESVRLSMLFDLLIKTPKKNSSSNSGESKAISHSVLCVGTSGVGKSVIMRRYLQNMCKVNSDDYETCEIALSAQTSSHILQSVFENKLEKLRKTLLGPKRGRRMLLFVDDLNMPKPDEYGSQPPLELLRQVIDNGGFYDRQKLFYKNIERVSYVAACGPPGGGRYTISTRLARHMHTIWVPDPPAESLQNVYESIFTGYLKTEVPELSDLQQLSRNIVSSTTEIYRAVLIHLRPTPKKSHYTFNTRDVSNVFQGMLMVNRQRLWQKDDTSAIAKVFEDESSNSAEEDASKNVFPTEKVIRKLLRLWLHEQSRVIYDRLIDESDQKWFADLCATTTSKNFPSRNIFVEDVMTDGNDGNDDNKNQQKTSSTEKNKEYLEGLMFATLSGADDDPDYREHIASSESAITSIGDELTTQLEEFKMMAGSGGNKEDSAPAVTDLVFFRDAVSHVARLTRILLQPRGNALLVGVGGSGRKSLSRLASYMSGSIIRTIQVTSQYGMAEWREDIKSNLMLAGLSQRKGVVFMLDDTQVVQESFLEDVNSILTSGEVLNIYEQEDLEKIVSESKASAEAAANGTTLGRESILNYYRQKVRESLHIVMTFSPIGNTFRQRMMAFPSFSNCCVVDWYHRWPQTALLSVARRLFHRRVSDIGGAQYVEKVSKVCMTIHATVEQESMNFYKSMGRYNYTTPTSYLELLRLLTDTVSEQRAKQQAYIGRYEQGVDLLDDTSTKVKLLQIELTELQPKLVKASKDTDTLMEKLQVDQQRAEETRKVASKEEAEASALAVDCDQQALECQGELDKAMPAYHSALKALDKLDKKSIGELKTFVQPPRMVGVVMEAVCLLLKKNPTWVEAKKLLGTLDFLDQLKNYDKDNMKDKLVRKVKKYTDMEEFTAEKVAKVSIAAMSLSMWVIAMVTYHTVVKKIAPMRATLADAQAKLAVVRRELAKKQEILSEVEATLQKLQKEYESSIQKKEDLLKQAEDTKKWLTNAERLNGAVGSERDRWAKIVVTLKKGMHTLLGNMIVSSGIIAYAGPFVSKNRLNLIQQWLASCTKNGVPITPLINDEDSILINSLGDDITTRKWRLLGLPQDNFSTENAIIATRAQRWPLCIDPQTQANRWIKNMEKKNNVVVCKMSEGDSGGDANTLVRHLENAVRVGLPLLIESLGETLDPILEPILTKTVIRKGGETMMKIGEKIIPYDERFKLYMTTKLPNPHYLPDICIKVTLINFGITSLGLEEQLLADVVKQERPDLSAKRGQLIVSIASDQKKVLDMEDRVLTMLSESTGNILDNEELISKLETAKKTSAVVKTRIEEGEKTNLLISTTREIYRPVATRGSVLYFTIAQLASIDSMYQYSLQFFQKLYNTRIEQAEKPIMKDELKEKIEKMMSEKTEGDLTKEEREEKEEIEKQLVLERLSILVEDITWTMYVSVCRGLFEKDKMVYAMTVASNILKQKTDMSVVEWNTLLITPSPSEQDLLSTPDSSTINEDSGASESWLTSETWCKLGFLQTQLPQIFSGLKSHVRKNINEWGTTVKQWFDPNAQTNSNNDHQTALQLPLTWESGIKLTPFQKLLLIKAMRSDLLVQGTNMFVQKTLGPQYGEAPALDLKAALSASSNTSPLIFVLSSGADPMSSLLALAKTHIEGGVNMRVTSLGQGQGPIAERHIESASAEGGWVCLQNCHLAVSWLPRLEQIVEKQVENGKSTHVDYRMWLTSMPCAEFPVSILQVGIKLSMQPPRGVRANMLRGLGTDIAAENFLFERNKNKRKKNKKKVQAQNDEEKNENENAAKEEKEEDKEDQEEEIDYGTASYCKMLYALVFYHACVLERRKFGGIGWNIPYEWMASDLKTGVLQLQLYLPHVYDEEGMKISSYDTNQEYLNNVPFDAIQMMMGEINYGGRVTDKWDLRPVADILGSLMCRALVDPTEKNYSLVPGSVTSSAKSMEGLDLKAYGVPAEATTREEMMAHVRNMPLLDDPRLFGLDTNANITCQLQESNELMDTILSLSGGGGGGGEDDGAGDAAMQDLGDNILSMFPGIIDREEAHPDTFANDESGGPTALAVVLTWEVIRFNKLIGVVRSSTEELLKALQGLVVMSSELEVASRDLQYQKVPSMWEAAAYPSLKPLGSWLTDLEQRIAFISGWMRDTRSNSSYWVSGLYFPQGFITGVKQQYARKTLTAIDRLKIRAHVVRNETNNDENVDLPQNAPSHGVFIHGLFLQGAHWDQQGGNASAQVASAQGIQFGGCLTDALPRVLFEGMPAMWLEPYDYESTKNDKKQIQYFCPIYKTTTRAGQLSTTGHSTNFIMPLDLTFAEGYEASHWVRRGVALIAQLDS